MLSLLSRLAAVEVGPEVPGLLHGLWQDDAPSLWQETGEAAHQHCASSHDQEGKRFPVRVQPGDERSRQSSDTRQGGAEAHREVPDGRGEHLGSVDKHHSEPSAGSSLPNEGETETRPEVGGIDEASADTGEAGDDLTDGEDGLASDGVHEDHGGEVAYKLDTSHGAETNEEVLAGRVQTETVETEGDHDPVERHNEETEEENWMLDQCTDVLTLSLHHGFDAHVVRTWELVRPSSHGDGDESSITALVGDQPPRRLRDDEGKEEEDDVWCCEDPLQDSPGGAVPPGDEHHVQEPDGEGNQGEDTDLSSVLRTSPFEQEDKTDEVGADTTGCHPNVEDREHEVATGEAIESLADDEE